MWDPTEDVVVLYNEMNERDYNEKRLGDPPDAGAEDVEEAHPSCISPDGTTVVTASGSTLKLWNASSGELEHEWETSGFVTGCCFSHDGKLFVCCSDNETLTLMHTIRWLQGDPGFSVFDFEGHAGCITHCCFSPDSRHILSSSDDTTLRIWDVGKGMLANTLEGHADAVTCCAWAPDSKTCLSGSDDATLRLWNPHFNRTLFVLKGHSKGIVACCYSAKSNVVLSTSWDGAMNAWDVNHGTLQHTLSHPGRCFTCVRFSPDGNIFVTGSANGSLRGVVDAIT